ncbi:MAG: Calx-beta domain-containing protein [bacterium]
MINVTSGDTGEATVSASSLTFTNTNWNTAQTVTITGMNDSEADGNQNVTVTLSVNDASSDNAYDALSDKTVTVTNGDDEVAGFTLSKTTATVNESGTTDSFTVVLDAQPSSDVVINVTSGDTGEATVSASSLTFTNTNWNTAQTVTITGMNDSEADGNQNVTVTLSVNDASSDNAYDALSDKTVTVTNGDDEVAGFTLSKTTATVNESGTTDSFTVVLDAQPSSDVVINVTSGDTGEATVSASSLTFTNTNWNTAQTVTITGMNDSEADGNQNVTVTLSVNDASSDNAYDALSDKTVTVTNGDDEVAGFTLSKTTATVNESGTEETFTVRLNTQPSSNVVVNVTSGDTGEAIVSPATLTFSDSNWNVIRTVTITGVDDSEVDGNQSFNISISVDDANSDDSYDSVADRTVAVTTTDDEPVAPEINIKGGDTSVSIMSGDTSPRTLDGTDFGTASTTKTFTIENIGNADLILSATPTIALSSNSSSAFRIFQAATTPINSNSSTTFSITYTAQASVISTATVIIKSNDSDESTYTFNIQGGEASDPIAPRAEKLRAYLAGDTDKHALQKFQNTGGDIHFAFDLVDSDNGTYTYTWSSSNTTLDALINNLGGSISDGTVTSNTLDISSLAAGKYPITVSVSDSTFTTNLNYTTKAEYTLEVVTAAVSNDDSNRDDDGDGVSNANDNKPNEANNVPARLSNQANYESKVETGYRITLGETAKAAQRTGLKVSSTDLANHGNNGSNATNTNLSSKTLDHVFDYVIEGVPVSNPNTGTSIRVVLPLETPLAANSTFHKYDANGGWSDFKADPNNFIEWADWEGGQQGVCPDPDSASYNKTDPQTGKTCLRMTIQDGGDNDQDGNVNGRIVDPLGIATPTTTSTSGGSSGGSSSSSGSASSSSCLQLEGVPSNTDQITENPQECSCGGYKTHYFMLELGEALTVDASVSYTTLDGTATAQEDYVAVSGTATIPAGANYAAIPVQLMNDNVAEPDETFSLVIRDPVGGVFPVGMTEIIATHVIRDDDRSGSAYLEAQPSQSHHVIKRPLEGDQNYTHYFLLELNQALTQTAQVHYKTESGTAIADQDFIAAEGTITIPAGQTHALIGVTLIGDQSDEDDETFSVVITDPKGGSFPESVTEIRATHTIVDDD